MAAGRWVGRGDKNAADQAAVDGMRTMLDIISMQGTVVIGEGEKDEAPMLYNGEAIGNGEGPEVDVAVDPLEGTRLTANGAPNAIAVIALADKGTMFFPGAAVYMDKIVVGPAAAEVIDIDAPPAENVRRTAEAKGMRPEDVTVVVLDRDRHAGLIAELRDVGARVQLITDGDVAPSIAAARQGRGRRSADGHRWHARGRDLCGCGEVPRWRDAGTALAAKRRGAAAARRGRVRRRPEADDGRPHRVRQRLRRRDRRHRRESCSTACATTPPVARRSRSSCAHGRARCGASSHTTRRASSSGSRPAGIDPPKRLPASPAPGSSRPSARDRSYAHDGGTRPAQPRHSRDRRPTP